MITEKRLYSPLDRILGELGHALQVCCGNNQSAAQRASPAADMDEPELQADARYWSAALMRVNHSGEIAAQALYRGQAVTARETGQQNKLLAAAAEEIDHLAWCEERLHALQSRRSHLAPLWYSGAFGIGVLAGLAGDGWSLGFVEETEKQVEEHLHGHMQRLPPEDKKSQAVVAQMRTDEARHATWAHQAGAQPLPTAVKALMRLTAKTMTVGSYYF